MWLLKNVGEDTFNFTLIYFGSPTAIWLQCNLPKEPKDLIRPAAAKIVLPHFYRPRLRYYKLSSSFNPHTRYLEHSAESTEGLHRSNGILSRASTTLTPRLAALLGIESATSRLQAQWLPNCARYLAWANKKFSVIFHNTVHIKLNHVIHNRISFPFFKL
jgi:hypothetical protein